MKKLLLSLALSAAVLLPSLTVYAQTSPTTGEAIADAVFSEVQKRVIRDYYDKIPGSEVIKDVVTTTTTTTTTTEVDDDDDRNGKGKHKKNKKDKHKGKGKNKGMPPGLAKKDQLPPGLAKRSTLPPGLAKRDIPDDLRKQLPPPPKGTEVSVVEDKVVLIEQATGTVLDILTDVIVGSTSK